MIDERWNDIVWQTRSVRWPCDVVIKVATAMTFGEAMTEYASATPFELPETRMASDRLRFMAASSRAVGSLFDEIADLPDA